MLAANVTEYAHFETKLVLRPALNLTSYIFSLRNLMTKMINMIEVMPYMAVMTDISALLPCRGMGQNGPTQLLNLASQLTSH